jgi:cytochrome-b5 reductase
MLDRNLVLFLTSFVAVFTSLVLISQYLNAKLKAAGYDVSRIILIGLPTNSSHDSTSSAPKIAFPWGLNSNMTTHPTFDLKDFQEKGYAQAAALILALLSSVFIYFKFGYASESKKPPS